MQKIRVSYQYPEIIIKEWEKHPEARFRIIVGGRGKSATWTFARKMIETSFRIKGGSGLCTRHIGRSHDLSTKKTLSLVINTCMQMDYRQDSSGYHRTPYCLKDDSICTDCNKKETLAKYFTVLSNRIRNNVTGFTIDFNSLSKITEDESKGAEDFSIVWIGEAHSVPLTSLQKFIPSIRRTKSEIWLDWNPENRDDAVGIYFLKDPEEYPPKAKDLKGGVMFAFLEATQNPFFSELLET